MPFVLHAEGGWPHRRWLSVDFAAVSQAYELHNQMGILNIDNDAVISDAVLPVIAQRGAYESLTEAAPCPVLPRSLRKGGNRRHESAALCQGTTSVVPARLNGSRALAPEGIYLFEAENVATVLLSPQGLKAIRFYLSCGTTEVVP